MSKKEFVTLTTPFEAEVGEIPYSEYPRPNMKRDSYFSLNGKWELTVRKKDKEVFSDEILVPFSPESKMSGVCRQFGYSDTLVYKRSFCLPEGFLKDRLLIHFGAVDRYAEVRINGCLVTCHDGGYLPFCADITKEIREGENLIEVTVTDDLDTDYPYGKQSKKRGGMWYTPVSGIWQSVWLESLPERYIEKLKITTDVTAAVIETAGGEEEKTLILHDGAVKKEYAYSGDVVKIQIDDPKVWTPDEPNIYRFELICGEDRIESYFALREISVGYRNERAYIFLNGKPTFFNGLLDQGYFSDGIYLPATPEGYKNDILTMKKLGFNMLRKHIKIEPQLFYYYCDIYGMVVFQDMVNSGKYNFLIDTALPTIGMKRGITHRASKKRREIFERSAKETAELLYNHPSVCYYTIFNEGWGQYDADRIYRELKAFDKTRIWDTTSGWFKTKESDVESEHVYFKPLDLHSNGKRPLVLSEFGGYSYKIEEHSFNPYQTYGYKKIPDREAFEKAMEELYIGQVLFTISEGLCATVLTQVSDVEDETNGLFTYDRQVLKVDAEKFKKISETLKKAFSEQFKKQ